MSSSALCGVPPPVNREASSLRPFLDRISCGGAQLHPDDWATPEISRIASFNLNVVASDDLKMRSGIRVGLAIPERKSAPQTIRKMATASQWTPSRVIGTLRRAIPAADPDPLP